MENKKDLLTSFSLHVLSVKIQDIKEIKVIPINGDTNSMVNTDTYIVGPIYKENSYLIQNLKDAF